MMTVGQCGVDLNLSVKKRVPGHHLLVWYVEKEIATCALHIAERQDPSGTSNLGAFYAVGIFHLLTSCSVKTHSMAGESIAVQPDNRRVAMRHSSMWIVVHVAGVDYSRRKSAT